MLECTNHPKRAMPRKKLRNEYEDSGVNAMRLVLCCSVSMLWGPPTFAADAPAGSAPAAAAAPAAAPASTGSVTVGAPAPQFKLKNQSGQEFDLASRKGKGWTVLYFYPKADSPGC